MDDKTTNELIIRIRVEDGIRQEFNQTLSDRVDRYLEVKPLEIVPYTHFSAVSVECALLFRDGHFYGCIALTQAVAEALVEFLCRKNSVKHSKDFKTNVTRLAKVQFITHDSKASLLKIWEGRNDYHHLNTTIATDRQTLERLAREKCKLLSMVEAEVFRFQIIDGVRVPEHPEYWDINDEKTQVFLRIDP